VIICKSANALAPEERPVYREDLGGLLRIALAGLFVNKATKNYCLNLK